MTQNHIFLVFDEWNHQHQIIFYISTQNGLLLKCLIKEGQTQQVHEEKKDAIIDFELKKREELSIFIKTHV